MKTPLIFAVIALTISISMLRAQDAPKPTPLETKVPIKKESTTIQWETNLSDALKTSYETGKPLMLFFTGSDWCGWCKRLKAEVFNLPDFGKWAAENVVLVELDFPKRTALPEDIQAQNNQLQQMFQIGGFPTIVFVRADEPGENGSVNLNEIGRTGYLQGGVPAWTGEASRILAQ